MNSRRCCSGNVALRTAGADPWGGAVAPPSGLQAGMEKLQAGEQNAIWLSEKLQAEIVLLGGFLAA
jgi:hypothetical protein